METDTCCPVCWESVHTDRPIGVTTACGHVYHQDCYVSWQRKGEYIFEASTTSSSCTKKRYTLNSHSNCLICRQPTQSFIDLFVRLPNASQGHKELVTKLEHEFHTVSRRTQLSLEKEIARREFEQKWLQEERQLSQVARQRAETRHEEAIQTLEKNLKELKVNYDRKSKNMEARRRRRSSSRSSGSQSIPGSGILQFHANQFYNPGSEEEEHSIGFSVLQTDSVNDDQTETGTDAGGNAESISSADELVIAEETAANDVSADLNTDEGSTDVQMQQASSVLGVATISNETVWQEPRPFLADMVHSDSRSLQSEGNHPAQSKESISAETTTVASFDHDLQEAHTASPNRKPAAQASPRARRNPRSPIQKDTIFHPETATPPALRFPLNMSRSRRSVFRDEIFAPVEVVASPSSSSASMASQDAKMPPFECENAESPDPCASPEQRSHATEVDDERKPASRKRKGSLKTADGEKSHREDHDSEDQEVMPTAETHVFMAGAAEYERQRLEAETTYYQHQAELVEWELHQAEIELEADELELQQRERQIRMERSRLEESFTSIQRRVEETKQEARDRQKLTVMEERFVKYKIARRKEEERFEQELEHLKQDEVHARDREKAEKQRQETEKVRLKKELNQLVKVMNELERAKETAKQAEEQSSASQSHETCVMCFEPLVNDDSELGVVECGHAFHSVCFGSWEKSKRRRGSSSVPCPLCNVATNICVTIRLNRPGASLFGSSTSSLAKHFQKEEGRWQRRKLTGYGLAGEASS